MKVYFCNINKINENVEDFVIAKNKIENDLIEEEKIEKKMTISEFLNYVNLQNSIFAINEKTLIVIPFQITQLENKDIVIIYSSSTNEEYENQFKEKLYEINYNLENLNKIDELQMLENIFERYFIINNKFYI